MRRNVAAGLAIGTLRSRSPQRPAAIKGGRSMIVTATATLCAGRKGLAAWSMTARR
jgi:hypothetical protein